MKKIAAYIILFITKIIGRKNTESLLIFSAKTIGVNLHIHGLVQIGAHSGFNSKNNGEEHFIRFILPKLIGNNSNLTFFDIGANIGSYSIILRECFPDAQINAFEPVISTFEQLSKNEKGYSIKVYNIGFSNSMGTGELFSTKQNLNSEIITTYKDAFQEIFDQKEEIITLNFTKDTIDGFCERNDISQIDFLKIDVEGHEFAVLQGAINMLAASAIKIIQFEFNIHNTYSRVFLRDFYSLLSGFNLYRLTPKGIMDLGMYNVVNEVFTGQNIIAINKGISSIII